MGILIDENSRVVVQGITGREGQFHTERMLEYGTKVVAGVSPGKKGTKVHGVPVFNTVAEAVEETGCDVACVFVPALFAADAVMESAFAGIPLIVVITEGIPVQDAIRMNYYAKMRGSRVIGPNGPGIITAGKCKVGIMPNEIFRKGNVGVISRSGTLTYEIVRLLVESGLGISTAVGIGGDSIPGSTFADLLPLFEQDEETESVVLIGEIGGTDEEDAAALLPGLPKLAKRTVAFISGRTAPPGKRMGHAGAIIMGGVGTAESKLRAFQQANIPVADSITDIPHLCQRLLTFPPTSHKI
ncbi:MAG: succinate--CoA ligase subunit alpha [bacterium JZ-2024 1]